MITSISSHAHVARAAAPVSFNQLSIRREIASLELSYSQTLNTIKMERLGNESSGTIATKSAQALWLQTTLAYLEAAAGHDTSSFSITV